MIVTSVVREEFNDKKADTAEDVLIIKIVNNNNDYNNNI